MWVVVRGWLCFFFFLVFFYFIYFYFLISHPQDPAVVSWWCFQKRSTETDREAGAGGRVSDKGITSVRVSCGLIVCIQVVVYGEYLACECKTEVVLLLLMLAKHTDGDRLSVSSGLG